MGQGPEETVWGSWVLIKDLAGMGKESLWFAGGKRGHLDHHHLQFLPLFFTTMSAP